MTTTTPDTPPIPGPGVRIDKQEGGRPAPFDGWPAFIREFESTLAVHSQFVLHGNLRDWFLVPGRDGGFTVVPLASLVWRVLERYGYSCLVVYDQVDGFTLFPRTDGDPRRAQERQAVERLLDGSGAKKEAGGDKDGPLAQLYERIKAVTQHPELRIGLVVDYASRLVRDPTELSPAEQDFFVGCLKLSETAPRKGGFENRPSPLYNPVVWLVQSDRDLPAWLGDGNVRVRNIAVPSPDLGEREKTARLLVGRMPGAREEAGNGALTGRAAAAAKEFAAAAEGLTLAAMGEVTKLVADRGTGPSSLPEAVRTYKLGVLDNPWRRGYLLDRIRQAETELPARVIGQERAVAGTLDVLKRAVLGLTGAQARRSVDRPRGTLFFAGPTGVGKTELAKAIAALLFGDESAYLRFDMSEFSAEHAADRLVGAPPGYVGYEAGGELTNAVRQDPFRVVLFDEIEKAHPRLLDKFLQILEDGRLTDARGNTTYFSETILIFTSNLGIQEWDPQREVRIVKVTPDQPYEEVIELVTEGVQKHFNLVLGRPELLNRLGGNILVFDFIRPEPARRICDNALGNVLRLVGKELGQTLTIGERASHDLLGWCTEDLANGGRGILNAVETGFVNPLARALFDRRRLEPGGRLTVTAVHRDPPSVELR
ncbi:AAA family ATPase [Actinomadura opuntiae]|uniref:AAA family ATPase n=1 Tax=Actinomadura sp. OS1-43 TaxID=604315 RepID=UPI00255AE522|nr:AAA family ATPase [Actinomadura sp. OS1-43]MDL4815009.1 AAA family ATPase [Actinomadura sp. OS1-43]